MEAFVVRLWTPGHGAEPAQSALRGTVLHVSSGAAAVFSDQGELLDFLAVSLGGEQGQATRIPRNDPGARPVPVHGHPDP